MKKFSKRYKRVIDELQTSYRRVIGISELRIVKLYGQIEDSIVWNYMVQIKSKFNEGYDYENERVMIMKMKEIEVYIYIR